MESITGESSSIWALRCSALVGVVVVGLAACAAPDTSTNSYKLVLDAPGLETVQPMVVVTYDDYSQIVERSTWNADKATGPKADLTLWRLKDNFRHKSVYVYEKPLPELVRSFLLGEWITIGAGGKSKNVLGALDYQRFRWKFNIECIFIRQGVDMSSDQVNVIGAGDPLGDMVIRGWYCADPTESNHDAVFQEFIAGIGIQGWAVP